MQFDHSLESFGTEQYFHVVLFAFSYSGSNVLVCGSNHAV